MAYPQITPMLAYEDAAAAVDWLVKAFGFRERLRFAEPDGTVTHAELELGDGLVMLASPSRAYQGPKRHAETCEAARAWLDNPYVVDGVHAYVDDVDKHFERAKATGAEILSEPRDTPYGDRNYRVADLEGHRWMFAQHVRDVAPEAWGASSG